MRIGKLEIKWGSRRQQSIFLDVKFNNIQADQEQLNSKLNDDFIILGSYQTEIGIVFHLWKEANFKTNIGSLSSEKIQTF